MSDPVPPALSILIRQACDQLQDGCAEEAAQTFSAVLAVDPHMPEALRGRGLAHMQLKRWSLAAVDFEAAARLAPADADAWVEWAKSLAMDGKIYPAMKVFETLLAREPECLRGHLELGLLHLQLGAIPKGRRHLQQALACRPPVAQRRQIERLLAEQDRLDRKRFYRPDFEALQKQRRGRGSPGWTQRLGTLLKRFRGNRTGM